MEYEFVRTVQGPVLMGDGEVLFFYQHGPLQDYVDSDPEFFKKAKQFCLDAFKEHTEMITSNMQGEIVPGMELANSFHAYLNAFNEIAQFEYHQQTQDGFPGNPL